VLRYLRDRSLPSRRDARGGDRGAVAVEAALIFPVLVLLIFGTIEFTLLLRDYVTVNSAVRSGARVASAEPRVATFAQDTADAIERSATAMPKNQIDFIYIYLANNKGFPGANGVTDFGACPGTRCVKYVWNDSLGRFNDDASGTWPASSINACPGEAQSVGVYMQATHNAVVGLFGNSWKVSDRAVMQFEPMRPGSCK
jgi:hypothetical protein